MCGIAGYVGLDVDSAVLDRMGAALVHRGPDDEGSYHEQRAGLVFRRLAIVDLAGGHQPMSNEDGQVQLVFNGEIYDHLEHRRLLQARGHHFATDHSDTEVLVHGWEEWGRELFGQLNGMFALAIWDRRAQQLVLARDRFGIKPLYYAALPDGGLVFASEIKAILASGLVPSQPSAEGVLEYFSFQNLWRDQTMFAGVHQLPPATILTWHNGQVRQQRFWDITFPRQRRGSLADLSAEHRDIMRRAIRRQSAADVPVKCYLSGGIDSTAITMVSHQFDPSVTAYSCIFDLDSVGKDSIVDERAFSRLVAESYAIDRVELQLDQDALQHCLQQYVNALEDLRMGMGYPIYLIAQRVAQDAKVVLSGTGGDEFHAGYVGRFQALAPPAAPSWGQLLKRWLRPHAETPRSFKDTYSSILNFMFKTAEQRQVFTPEFLRQTNGFDADAVIAELLEQCPSKDWRDRVLYVDAKTYLTGLLNIEDKLSMAHSLETRVPLLDNEVVDFVLDVPFDALWQGDTGKVLFRETVRPWVPDDIYRKPKMGFGPPDASWYRGRLRPWIEEMLSPRNVAARGVFQPAYVAKVLDDHFHERREATYLIWSWLNFEMWCRQFGFFDAPAGARLSDQRQGANRCAANYLPCSTGAWA